jgi:DNA excision repair protein ERCC-2
LTVAGLRVSVRELCEFTAKRGDLDLRFTPAPTAQQGIEGHGIVAGRRLSSSATYRRELPLEAVHGNLLVVGRADGYDSHTHRLEEVKTHRGPLERLPDNHRALHWAQARCYGAMLCQAQGHASITIALVYYDIGSGVETVVERCETREALQADFASACEVFQAWAQREAEHRRARDAAFASLRFAHTEFREGQRELARQAFHAVRRGRRLMAQAPTGIGKTVGMLFPVLKAAPEAGLDKIFYLTAKTSGRALAVSALARLARGTVAKPRVIELVARDKACLHPDKACHGESCPLARGFYDRLPAARARALEVAPPDIDPTVDPRAHVESVAREHAICPYYLTQELVRWADVVVADYNHFYDASALLHAATLAHEWRVAVLVDEAHNLPDRAREMHSVSLHSTSLETLSKAWPRGGLPRRAIDRLRRAWRPLVTPVTMPYTPMPMPDAWVKAVAASASDLAEHFARHPEQLDPALLELHLALLRFDALASTFGDHSIFDVTVPSLDAPAGLRRSASKPTAHAAPASARALRRTPPSTLSIRNVVPASFVAPRHAAAHAVMLFSATLEPARFYLDMLGMPDDTAVLDVESPFRADQLEVHIARHVSTRWRDRERSIDPIVDIIAEQHRRRPGNYLAFFGSYEYMERVANAFAAVRPEIPTWRQSRGMSEAERETYLEHFEDRDDSGGIGFAVLGGVFAEGIDLPGERLLGVFIATLGMPQVNAVNEAICDRLQSKFGFGFDYAYRFPGLRKVVQAAGRVIRSPDDQGVVHLIDDRFAIPDVSCLLPRWWGVGRDARSFGDREDLRLAWTSFREFETK